MSPDGGLNYNTIKLISDAQKAIKGGRSKDGGRQHELHRRVYENWLRDGEECSEKR